MKRIGPRRLLICNGCPSLSEIQHYNSCSYAEEYPFVEYRCLQMKERIFMSYDGKCKVETPKSCPFMKKNK